MYRMKNAVRHGLNMKISGCHRHGCLSYLKLQILCVRLDFVSLLLG